MILHHIATPARLLRRVLSVRPWWHASGIGWALHVNAEAAEFFRTLGDALQATRVLER